MGFMVEGAGRAAPVEVGVVVGSVVWVAGGGGVELRHLEGLGPEQRVTEQHHQ